MGTNIDKYKQILEKLDQLASNDENFKKLLCDKYGNHPDKYENTDDFHSLVVLHHNKCRSVARNYYKKIKEQKLRMQLIDYHANMLWFKSIRDVPGFFVNVNYQIEDMMNYYLAQTDFYNKVNSYPTNYSHKIIINPGSNYEIDINICKGLKNNDINIPIKQISMWNKIVFWAVDTNHMDFVRSQASNFSSIINIRNESNHADYLKTTKSTDYWNSMEDDMSYSFIYAIIKIIRESIIDLQNNIS